MSFFDFFTKKNDAKVATGESAEYDARVLVYDRDVLIYVHYFDLWDNFNGIYNYGVYIDLCKRIKYKLIFQTYIDKYKSGIVLDKKLFLTDGRPCNDLCSIIESLKKLRNHSSKKAICRDVVNDKDLVVESCDEHRQRNSPMNMIEKMFEDGACDTEDVNVYFRDAFKAWFCN